MKTPILDVNYRVACFFLLKHGQVLIMDHGLSNLNDGLVLSLCNPIPLIVVKNS